VERTDYCVIGGGIVGLATAYQLLRKQPGASLVLLEAAETLASHQTGHNSGVIHSGIYYAPGSLKARFSKAGAQQTKDFCREHGIRYAEPGKLLVATSEVELARRTAWRNAPPSTNLTANASTRQSSGGASPTFQGWAHCSFPAPASWTTGRWRAGWRSSSGTPADASSREPG